MEKFLGFLNGIRLGNSGLDYGLDSLGFNSQHTGSRTLPTSYSMCCRCSLPRVPWHEADNSPPFRAVNKNEQRLYLYRLPPPPPHLPSLCAQCYFTIYLHNKGWDYLVILNPLLPSALLSRTSQNGSTLISEAEDHSGHFHGGFIFMLCTKPSMKIQPL
jgi:hypothetical protein